MTKPMKEWTVLPHGKLTQVDEGLLTVVGELKMPLGDFTRRMTVVRLDDDRLVIFSAIALQEPEMRQLEAYGDPAFLIVPNDLHRIDAKVWKDRYPELIVVAPPGARQKVSEVVSVDADSVDFKDSAVRYLNVLGTEGSEAALIVRRRTGTTLIVNDLIWNVPDQPGIGGWLFHAMGLSGDHPLIPFVVKLHSIRDRAAVRHQLQEWSRLNGLHRIIVSHGDIIGSEAPIVLRELANGLAA
jgi:hypothetical protein